MERYIAALIKALEDEDEDVRLAAAKALEKIGPKAEAAVDLVKIGAKAEAVEPALIEAFEDEDEVISERSADWIELTTRMKPSEHKAYLQKSVVEQKKEPNGEKEFPSLVVISEGEAQGNIYPLEEKTLTVGRLENCDIHLRDVTVSRSHCEIVYDSKYLTWEIRDTGSSHGVRINDRRIQSVQVLHNGDKIQIGKTVLEVRAVRRIASPINENGF